MATGYIGNRGGVPIVTTTPVVSATDVRYVLPNHTFRFLGAKGMIIISGGIPTGTTTTLPVLIEVNGETKPLTNIDGNAVTVATVGTIKLIEVLFDKQSGTLQTLTF